MPSGGKKNLDNGNADSITILSVHVAFSYWHCKPIFAYLILVSTQANELCTCIWGNILILGYHDYDVDHITTKTIHKISEYRGSLLVTTKVYLHHNLRSITQHSAAHHHLLAATYVVSQMQPIKLRPTKIYKVTGILVYAA